MVSSTCACSCFSRARSSSLSDSGVRSVAVGVWLVIEDDIVECSTTPAVTVLEVLGGPPLRYLSHAGLLKTSQLLHQLMKKACNSCCSVARLKRLFPSGANEAAG